MTIPSRPAPAPPGSRAQNAAAGANASLEQLRLQLQQQHQQQQLNGGIQKLTIKLPPPPKGPTHGYQLQHNNNNNNSSITRKFPQARYTPTTNWDDSPFGGAPLAATASTNGNAKKMPPPRPPPPKVQVSSGARKNSSTATTAPAANILSNIFNRKKHNTKSATSNNSASRIYGVSSGNYGTTTTTTSNTTNTNISTTTYNNSASNIDWNAVWNTTSSTYNVSSTKTTGISSQDAQLISFDSPPSSPTFTQKSNSDCVSVDSFSSDSNFSSPNNGSVSQPESGFEDDFSAARSRPNTTSPLDPWETLDAFGPDAGAAAYSSATAIGTAPVRNFSTINTRMQASNDNPLCNGKSLLPPAPTLSMPTIIKPKISAKPKAPKPPMFTRQYASASHAGTSHSYSPSSPPSPPMPQFPPPSLSTAGGEVSLLDVISGKVDAIHLGGGGGTSRDYGEEFVQPYGIALYDFEGLEEGDLCFRENERIYLLEQVSDEWYRGRTRSGCEGIFPANYVDIKVPLSSPAALSTTISSSTTSSSSIATTTYQQQPMSTNGYAGGSSFVPSKLRCLYNFPAEVEGDLPLKENDMVTVLYRINEDWLFGEINGRQGQFPANFLEYVPDNIPLP